MLNRNNKKDLLLSENECRLIEQACCDNETGNHLLGRKRPDGYWEMRTEIYLASIAEQPTEREAQINEYCKQCSDYHYWKSLPDDEKMFVEVNEEEA